MNAHLSSRCKTADPLCLSGKDSFTRDSMIEISLCPAAHGGQGPPVRHPRLFLRNCGLPARPRVKIAQWSDEPEAPGVARYRGFRVKPAETIPSLYAFARCSIISCSQTGGRDGYRREETARFKRKSVE
jgi:hypothetical protein